MKNIKVFLYEVDFKLREFKGINRVLGLEGFI